MCVELWIFFLGFVERTVETKVERLSNGIEIIIGGKTNKQCQVFGDGCHPQKEAVFGLQNASKWVPRSAREAEEEGQHQTHTSDTRRGQTGSMRLQPTTCATPATEHLNGRQCGQAGTREESWHTQLDRPHRDAKRSKGRRGGEPHEGSCLFSRRIRQISGTCGEAARSSRGVGLAPTRERRRGLPLIE